LEKEIIIKFWWRNKTK